MEQASPFEVSVTTPSTAASGLCVQFGTLEIEKTPDLSACGTTTIKCERKHCQRLVPQTTVRKVMAREPNGTTKAMLVCPDCFNHYRTKSSTTSVNRATRSLSGVNFGQIRKDVAFSQRGNQAHVMPVNRNGNTRQPKAAPAGHLDQAGEGVPFKLPPLEVSLPKEYTAPLALKHYESLRDQLRQRTHADCVKEAQEHRDSARTHQNNPHNDLGSDHHLASNGTLLVSYTEESANSYATQSRISTHTRPHPRPRPIYGKKRRMSKSLSLDDMPATANTCKKQTPSPQTLGDQKRARTGQTSYVMLNTHSIREALIVQHEPPATVVDGLLSFPILFWLCPTKPLKLLISSHCATNSSFGDWMDEVHPKNGFIFFNTAQNLQYGAFKSMREGQIDLRWVMSLFVDSRLSGQAHFFKTFMTLSSHIIKVTVATCPVTIPQFRFVTSGLAMTNVPGAAPKQKEVYLVEQLIQSDDGPWRKYINNNSSHPCCLVFTSDFQGGDTLLTDPQIITHPDLGHKLFSKGNVQRTHRDFESEHKCNIFCKFFEVPTSIVQSDQLETLSPHSQNNQQSHISGSQPLLYPED
ncbi:hypothetical protein BJY52DRAFT_1226912 [Lactarius psammicola]|nr:hypothetical protein BJY52DRAFT_1226912 [Lactarius psammicola]